MASVACCVEEACTPSDLKTTFDFATQVCGFIGVDIGNPACNASKPDAGNDKSTKNGTKQH